MTQPSNQPAQRTAETHALVERLLNEELTAAEGERLESLVVECPQCRERYLRLMRLHAAIPHALAGGDGTPREEGQPPPADPGVFPALWGSLSSAFDWRTHPVWFTLLVTAIMAGCWGGLILLVHSARVQPMVEHAAKPAPEPEAKLPGPVALLRQYDGTVWADGAEGMPSIGWGYFLGDTLDLAEGLARFEFSDGAEIVIEGPSQITFEGGNAARLEHGKLAARVKKHSAHGFVVDTPFATVTDLGTEFGVAVCDEAADVEVYHGAVVMQVAQSSGGKQAVRIIAGGAAKADRAGNLTPSEGGSGRLAIVRDISRAAEREAASATIVLLTNPSFESPKLEPGAIDEQTVPDGWVGAGEKVGLIHHDRFRMARTPHGSQWAHVHGRGARLGQAIGDGLQFLGYRLDVSYIATRRREAGTNIDHNVMVIAGSSSTFVDGVVLDSVHYNTNLPNSKVNTHAAISVSLDAAGDVGGHSQLWLVFENRLAYSGKLDQQLHLDHVAVRAVPTAKQVTPERTDPNDRSGSHAAPAEQRRHRAGEPGTQRGGERLERPITERERRIP